MLFFIFILFGCIDAASHGKDRLGTSNIIPTENHGIALTFTYKQGDLNFKEKIIYPVEFEQKSNLFSISIFKSFCETFLMARKSLSRTLALLEDEDFESLNRENVIFGKDLGRSSLLQTKLMVYFMARDKLCYYFRDYMKLKHPDIELIDSVVLSTVALMDPSEISDWKRNLGMSEVDGVSRIPAIKGQTIIRESHVPDVKAEKEKKRRKFVFTCAFYYGDDDLDFETSTSGDGIDFSCFLIKKSIIELLSILKDVCPVAYLAIKIPYEVCKNLYLFYKWYKKVCKQHRIPAAPEQVFAEHVEVDHAALAGPSEISSRRLLETHFSPEECMILENSFNQST